MILVPVIGKDDTVATRPDRRATFVTTPRAPHRTPGDCAFTGTGVEVQVHVRRSFGCPTVVSFDGRPVHEVVVPVASMVWAGLHYDTISVSCHSRTLSQPLLYTPTTQPSVFHDRQSSHRRPFRGRVSHVPYPTSHMPGTSWCRRGRAYRMGVSTSRTSLVSSSRVVVASNRRLRGTTSFGDGAPSAVPRPDRQLGGAAVLQPFVGTVVRVGILRLPRELRARGGVVTSVRRSLCVGALRVWNDEGRLVAPGNLFVLRPTQPPDMERRVPQRASRLPVRSVVASASSLCTSLGTLPFPANLSLMERVSHSIRHVTHVVSGRAEISLIVYIRAGGVLQ